MLAYPKTGGIFLSSLDSRSFRQRQRQQLQQRYSPEHVELSAGGKKMPSSQGDSGRRSSMAPPATTERQGAEHTTGGFKEDLSQHWLTSVRVGKFRPIVI